MLMGAFISILSLPLLGGHGEATAGVMADGGIATKFFHQSSTDESMIPLPPPETPPADIDPQTLEEDILASKIEGPLFAERTEIVEGKCHLQKGGELYNFSLNIDKKRRKVVFGYYYYPPSPSSAQDESLSNYCDGGIVTMILQYDTSEDDHQDHG
ncbi:MAG: hypothetical protein OXU73_01315 [Candidatus Campbellbacteria bacterium]|nr:hypothetical protein [Candidatus Campbellbacteria bacterium]